jgi:hypothetical protein
VTFLAFADPQIGRRCSDNSNTWPPYANISVADCRAFQGNTLDALLSYAEAIEVDFVVGLGDYVDTATSTNQRTVIRDVIASHSGLTYHWVVGNHDARPGSNNYCDYLPRYILDKFSDVAPTRTPLWETWQVGGVHFMGMASLLWDTYALDCYATPDDGDCLDYDENAGTSCTSGGASDGNAYGTSTTCLADEVCVDWDGYAADQVSAVTAAVTAKEADSDAVAMFFFTHQTFWPDDDADILSLADDNNTIHNMRTCAGGDNDGEYCNDNGDTCTGGSGCVTDASGKNWRTQVDAALGPLSTTAYIVSGHNHDDLSWSGTTASGADVDYVSYSVAGSAAPDGSANQLTGLLVTINAAGTPTFQRILATWQGVEVFDAKLSGVEVF